MTLARWLNEARILGVEDDAQAGRLVICLLAQAGYSKVRVEQEPSTAIIAFRDFRPDLVLLDLHMPRGNGFMLLEEMNGLIGSSSYLPIVVLTGDLTAQARHRALVIGAADFITKPYEPSELLHRIRNQLRMRFLHLRLQAHAEQLGMEVERRVREVERAHEEILERLALASDFRDDETGQHTRRVGELSARIALRLGFSSEQARRIGQAALLHDVGKIGIPDVILTEPGALTEQQFETMKEHTRIGARILAGGESELVMLAEQIAHHHHERWDGTGYPDGLRGDEIPLAARIAAVADYFDALSHARCYRPAVPVTEVVEMVRQRAGSHFDPDVVRAFLAQLDLTWGTPPAMREFAVEFSPGDVKGPDSA